MNREVQPGEFFLYQRGAVSTSFPWDRPSYNTVKSYLEYLKEETQIFDEFEVYLGGGILYSFENTWDVDIFLVGGTQTDQRIEEQLNLMTDIALNKFFLLVDIGWYERKPSDFSYSQMEANNFLQEDITYKKIGYLKKQMGSETYEYHMKDNPHMELIGEYLVKSSFGGFRHLDKMIDKVRDNPKPTVIATFSAEEFLLSDENYFLENTNR